MFNLFNSKDEKKDITQRSWTLAGGLFVVAVAIVWRIVYIQHYEKFKGKPWVAQLDRTIHQDTIPAMRGNIYSSDGSLLATSLPYYEISIDPTFADSTYFYQRIDSLCNKVVTYFGKDALIEDSKKIRFNRKEWEFEQKKRNEGKEIGKSTFSRNIRLVAGIITFKQQETIKTWPFFRKLTSGKTKGGILKLIYKRYKPFGTMAERIIGQLDSSKHGSVGIEANYDTRLFGKPGIGKYEILSDGTRMPLSDDDRLYAESGADIHLTIDVNFQDIAETSLRQTLKRYQADYGCAVVMKIETGEIKAMANLSKTGDSTYRETYNHALLQRSNPGSTLKLATIMAALETGKITPNTLLETGNGSAYYRNVTIEDTKAHGTITAQEAIIESSNVGMHLLMAKSGFYGDIQKYLNFLKKFKLDDTTHYVINGEAHPLTPKPHHEGWDGTSATRLSYGYVWELTPLQILTFYNAVANDGKWVKPMLVKQIQNNEDIIHDGKPFIDPKPIASQQTILSVQKMLLGVVENEKGTAHSLKNTEYQIAGKTGTAQLILNGRYAKGKYNVSFVGYFPAKKPQYSCIVMVSHPRGGSSDNLYAGSVAAPVFKNIADRIVGYDVRMHPPMANNNNKLSAMAKHFKAGHSDDLRLIADNINLDSKPQLSGWVEAKGNGNKIKWTAKNADPNRLPDMHGMSLRDALYLLENNGFRVTYQGRGKVTSYLRKGNVFELILK
jgi:cell division protein FtsI (penicillin-binding protein 3)